jgi:hypothetical protein
MTTTSFCREDELVFDTVDGSDGAVSKFLYSLLDLARAFIFLFYRSENGI